MRLFWFLMIGGSLLVAMASGLQLLSFQSLLDAHFKQGTRNQGELLGGLMADSLSQKLLDGRRLEIRESLRDLVEQQDWIAYAYLTDFDGRLAAHSFERGFPKALLSRLGADDPRAVVAFQGEGAVINDLAVPLIPGLPATLHIGINEQPLAQLSRELIGRVFRLSLVVLLISVLLWWMMARKIARPLQRITARIDAYRQGEVPQQDAGSTPLSGFREIDGLERQLDQTIRERRQLESLLQDREAYLRLLVEHSPVGLALTRMDGELVEVNQAYADITGYPRDELPGMSYWQITPREYEPQERQQLEALESTGRYGPYEKEYIHRDGHRVPVRLSGLIIQRDGERFIWSSVEDVSDRHQAERLALMFEHLLRHAEEEIFLVDPTSLRIIEASRGACERLDYGIEELKRLTPMDINPDLMPEQARRVVQSLEQEGGQRVMQGEHRRRNGERYPVEVRLQMLGEGMDRVIFVSVFDLSGLQRRAEAAEAERLELERRVEERTASIRLQSRIIEQTSDAIVTCNLEGEITGWYGGAARYFGLDSEQALGRGLRELFPDAEAYAFHTRYILPVLEQGRLELEATLRHADGRSLPSQLQFSLLKDEQGRPSGLIMTSIDISTIRQREQELQVMTRRLEVVNQELESFSYSVSHDLRAPLRAIDGFSQALLEDYGDRLDEEGRDYLQRVRAGAQRMAELIDDLLDLSRVNRSEMKPKWVDLSEIAAEVIAELRQGEPDRSVEVVIEPGLRVWADARLMRVMLHNLLGNAWKFTGRTEKPRIMLRSSEALAHSFCVEDNGVGFDMRHAGKLFGAFQRLHRVSEFPGTGIGLATVKRIINRHGGEIEAHAEPGQGARFCFTLPVQPPGVDTTITEEME